MVIFILAFLGLIWGSFVNAFIWRIHSHKDWVNERSQCPKCHHLLSPKDLVPVVSWVLLRGKCRYCHGHIDDSPIVEVVLPILFIASYIWWPLPFNGAGLVKFILWLVFLIGFEILAVYDIRWLLLPNKIVYPFTLLALLQALVMLVFFHAGWSSIVSAALGVLIISGSFYLLFQISGGRWIGGGDVKLGILLGLLVGGPIPSLLLLFIASLSGTAVAVPLMIKGKAKSKSIVPFGPFLLFGATVVVIFGARIINWYTNLVF